MMRLYIWPQLKKNWWASKSFMARLLTGKADTGTHLFWSQGQSFFRFNEVSPLLWTSNFLSVSALLYTMCSALWFKLKVYSHTFFLICAIIFEALIRGRFCLVLFLLLLCFVFLLLEIVTIQPLNTDIGLHESPYFWSDVLGRPYLWL